MKFGKQLELGIYEPWRDYYVQYNRLKRIIQRLQFIAEKKNDRAEKAAQAIEDSKAQTFLELTKTASFNSQADERTPLTTFEQLEETKSYRAPPAIPKGNKKEKSRHVLEDGLDFFACILEEMKTANNFYAGKCAEVHIKLNELTGPRTNTYVTHHTSTDPNFLLKLREIYIEVAALKQYSELNKTGFYKIIKKYDKAMGTHTLEEWLTTLDAQPFTLTADPDDMMDRVTQLVSRDKLLEWDRQAAQQQKANDDIFPSVRSWGIAAAVLVYLVCSSVDLISADDPCAQRCLTLLMTTLTLWVTEAIPYYTTAILIPIFVTTMGVLKDPLHPGKPMTTTAAANYVMNNVCNHTTFLLLGGYTISTAFARCQLELRVAAWLQKRFGNSPQLFILAVMFLGLFLSMWINNHTAPILCATIILPVVRDLPNDSRFSRTLLLGLAYACNYGGMMTPISSMQNVLAVTYLQQAGHTVTFGQWILVSVPFGVLNTVLAWAYLVIMMRPDDISSIPLIAYERGNAVLGKRNITVIVSSLLTILLFANFTYVEPFLGEIGIVAAIYVVFMFGSGILTEMDFNSLNWHTIFLVGGGNVLGKAVSSSGLLAYISGDITHALPLSQPWVALLVILLFCLTAATFVSHTVASLVLMPVISSLGISIGMPEIAVIGSAFAISAAMALPFSSFPNVNSVLIVDDVQRPYLGVSDFVKTGLPLSLLCTLLIATVGYLLIKLIIAPQG